MRLVVLGDPVSHSLSPTLHNTGLAVSALTGTYEARRVDAAGMAAAVAEIRSGSLDGANVTMPHKELAARLCDRLAATAARAGAVNTMVRIGGQVVGHNTDIAGIRAAWRSAQLPTAGPVLILGAGGAAAAAVLALEDHPLTISARRTGAADRLLSRVDSAAAVVPWGAVVPGVVVVNATPLGMRGESLEEDQLAAATGLFDMTYGSGETDAARQMALRGLPVADGRLMLVHQAAVAFELWAGRPAPLPQMLAAALKGAAT